MVAATAVPFDNWCNQQMRRASIEAKIAALEKKAELAPPDTIVLSDRLYKYSGLDPYYEGYFSPEATINFKIALVGICVLTCFFCCYMLCIKKGPENSGFPNFTVKESDDFFIFYNKCFEDFSILPVILEFAVHFFLLFLFFYLILYNFHRLIRSKVWPGP